MTTDFIDSSPVAAPSVFPLISLVVREIAKFRLAASRGHL